jgi:hypothetical protein
LCVFREKGGKKKKDLFLDSTVYSKNRSFRLPWATKLGEFRHFYPVLNGKVRRDWENPDWDWMNQALISYWEGGKPSFEPFAYPLESLIPRSNRPPLNSPTQQGSNNNNQTPSTQNNIVEHQVTNWLKFVEDTLFSQIRREIVTPKSLAEEKCVLKLQNLQALVVECEIPKPIPPPVPQNVVPSIDEDLDILGSSFVV